ncbi:hypothetical protein ABL840_26840 [Variovorax sp. NFACC27]|uniref:hypothetical protein n=1 Tax=unclassified Variovorax TaxID=663243 RepID=UPI000898AA28|nr:hypothetical protein SAMN03159371_03682 [Variovorax sp. NFACC28]SEG78021.1 hypothetical protein SAMN03159365_03761 [Variovorax sp. NFACC29]SFC96237.1 hypothetical protein SAMN03159379_03662 [Variovorax sp. NFACC26]SFG09297.1 hypothetical protein SAMN03159447_01770 [Variovorax sp. NFACC27]
MTTAFTIAQVAVSAQRNLHQIAVYERSLHQRAAPAAAAALRPYRAVERARLDACAEHFAALQPANDLAFEQSPEHA